MKWVLAALLVLNIALTAFRCGQHAQAKKDADSQCKQHHFDGAREDLNGRWLCYVQGAPEDNEKSWYLVDLSDAGDYELEALNMHEKLKMWNHK